ncbi:MAG: energy-coupling factor transporter transmembrane component T [Eubacteriales bacterium]|nr:energy-coupling factor transporter transmembrane component T [Eubacteriales bacterium]
MKMDVRYKFFLLILISITAFSAKDLLYGSLVFALVSALTFLLGQGLKTLKFIVAYALILVFILLSKHLPAFLRSMFLIIALCARMCMPIALYGQSFLKSSSVSEMVTGLYTLHLPRAFVISFAVAMRFFPTVREEIQHLREAMWLRGLEFSLRNLRKRPVLLLEGLIAPLLIRVSTTAEELSAASITRGLDNPAPRTAFKKLKIGFLDSFVFLLFSMAFIAICLIRTR